MHGGSTAHLFLSFTPITEISVCAAVVPYAQWIPCSHIYGYVELYSTQVDFLLAFLLNIDGVVSGVIGYRILCNELIGLRRGHLWND